MNINNNINKGNKDKHNKKDNSKNGYLIQRRGTNVLFNTNKKRNLRMN